MRTNNSRSEIALAIQSALDDAGAEAPTGRLPLTTEGQGAIPETEYPGDEADTQRYENALVIRSGNFVSHNDRRAVA
jgi:hypothetical protein